MTPGEFREFAKTMHEFGFSKIKVGDVEIFAGSPMAHELTQEVKTDSIVPTEQDSKIKHKIEQVQSLMKLDDHELLDKLFPEPQAEESA